MVTTTTILGDLASAVAGDAADVEVLIPIGVDPHDYQPSSRQIALLADADLIVLNGLDAEAGPDDAISGAAADGATVLELAPLLEPPLADGEGLDPHVWLDPVRMASAADMVADALTELDPDAGFADRGAAYSADLLAADATIRELLSPISEDRRLLVTNHEAFGYFAARYGFTVVGIGDPWKVQRAEPSSAELAALVAVIRDRGVPAINAETTQPTALADAVAAEAGTAIAVISCIASRSGCQVLPRQHFPACWSKTLVALRRRCHDRWLTDPFALAFQRSALLGGALAAIATSAVGIWVVVRGMTFSATHWYTESYRASPSPHSSASTRRSALRSRAVVMIGGIRLVHRQTAFSEDTGIGLLFVGMLGLGAILISRTASYTGSLTAILFGNALGVTAAT